VDYQIIISQHNMFSFDIKSIALQLLNLPALKSIAIAESMREIGARTSDMVSDKFRGMPNISVLLE